MTIANDIIIYGFNVDGSDHDRTVRKVLEKAKSVGMRFNPSKCQFRKTEVKFFWTGTNKGRCHSQSSQNRCTQKFARA